MLRWRVRSVSLIFSYSASVCVCVFLFPFVCVRLHKYQSPLCHLEPAYRFREVAAYARQTPRSGKQCQHAFDHRFTYLVARQLSLRGSVPTLTGFASSLGQWAAELHGVACVSVQHDCENHHHPAKHMSRHIHTHPRASVCMHACKYAGKYVCICLSRKW